MKDIYFPSLKRIYLPKNNIESVEIFCRMRMPVLGEFNIGLNYVICIDSVRKANWPNFFNLNFSRCWDMKMGAVWWRSRRSMSWAATTCRKFMWN